MKVKHLMYCTAIAAMSVGAVSCTNNSEEVVEAQKMAEKPLKIEVGINQLGTRSGIMESLFKNKEQIGLYLYKGTGLDAGSANRYPSVVPHKTANSMYFENSGLWQAETLDKGIILSDEKGILYAYYPYAETNNTIEADAIPLTVNALQGTGLSDGTKDVAEQSDYMWADPVKDVNNSTTTTTLSMNHALSMVSFKFIKGSYPGAANITSIKLINKAGKTNIKQGNATMNIGNGELAIAGVGEVVEIQPNTVLAKEKGHSYINSEIARMLVFPTGPAAFADGDIQAVITMDTKVFTVNLPAHIDRVAAHSGKYIAGKNYEYTFNLAGRTFGGNPDPDKPVDPEIDPNNPNDVWKDDVKVEIKKWIDVPAGEGEIVSPEKPELNPIKPINPIV